MIARVVLAATVLLALGGTALQASAAEDTTRKDVCLTFGGDGRLLPPEFCIGWNEAASK